MTGDDISTANLNLYAYSYTYDNRNNCTQKKLPGAAAVNYVYDQANKLVFSQDGSQATKNPQEWSFYLYDKYKRLTVQGVCANTNTEALAGTVVTCSFTQANTGIGESGYTTNYTLVSPQAHTVNYYDNYRFRNLTGFNDTNLQADTVNAQGMLTGSASYISGTSTKICTVMYYDGKGRLVKNLSGNHLPGRFGKTTTTYDFAGKPLTVQHIHQGAGKATQTELYTYTYNDPLERLTKVTHRLNSSAAVTLMEYTYDNLGRLATKKPHGSATNPVTYTYNIRNWLTGIASNRFTQNLYYNTGYGVARYNGNISSMTWKAAAESTLRGYKFTYDGLDRLSNAVYGEGTTIAGTNRFGETPTYDKHGNITQFVRMNNGTSATLAMGYTGNQLTRKGTSAYAYDANGNMAVQTYFLYFLLF